MPHVRRVIDGERRNHIQTNKRRHIHNDVPAVRTVFVRSGVAFEELFEIEFLFGSGRFDALFYENRAYDEPAAEQDAEDYAQAEPELHRGHIRHKEVSVFVDERFDEKQGQDVGEPARHGVEDQLDGVGVVAFLERGRNVARHRTVRHHRYGGERVPEDVHYDDERRKSADGNAPVPDGHKHNENADEKQHAARKHIRFAPAEPAAGVVADEAHDGVGDGVPELRDKHNRGRNAHCNAHRGHIFEHHAGHQRDAAAVHKRSASVSEFLFCGDVIRRQTVRKVFCRFCCFSGNH